MNPQTKPWPHAVATTSTEPAWLQAWRQQQGAAFPGLPTRKYETWRYSPLVHLARADFSGKGANVSEVSLLDIPDDAAAVVTVCNGRATVVIDNLPEGARLTTLAELLRTNPQHVQDLFATADAIAAEIATPLPLVALNANYMADGLVLLVDEGIDIAAPIYVQTICDGANRMAHPRHFIMAGRGSRVQVIETQSGTGVEYFHNPAWFVDVAAAANVQHIVRQHLAAHTTQTGAIVARVAELGVYSAFSLAFGGQLNRLDVHVALVGAQADARIYGAYAASQGQHIDHAITIEHKAPRTTSSQLFKGILDGNGVGVFQGKTLVHRIAQLTDGAQLHKAMVLSDRAQVNCKPELEIYADDVKCSHGATVGALDDAQLFYLQSRGISEPEARVMLMEAFLDDVFLGAFDEDSAEFALLKGDVVQWLADRAAKIAQQAEV
jgi:Fe-S cluster assembly protein SufD